MEIESHVAAEKETFRIQHHIIESSECVCAVSVVVCCSHQFSVYLQFELKSAIRIVIKSINK